MTVAELIAHARDQNPDSAEWIEDVVQSTRFCVVVNQAKSDEGERVFKTLAAVARKFLEVDMISLGHVEADGQIKDAVVHGRAPLLGKSLFTSKVWEHLNSQIEPLLAVGINEEIRLHEEILHVQTEDLGPGAGGYHTLVYSGGKILLGKRVPYESSFFDRAVSELKQDRVRFLHRTVIQAILSGRIKIRMPGSRAEDAANQGGEDEAEHATGPDSP
jgi:hypothetical protein